MQSPADQQPLAGIRVLDYSQFVAGPLAAMILADLGAEVIKVEAPRGDAYREYEPLGNGQSRRFMALNRGKRSLCLDLTTESDRSTSRALIRTADVVVHNMPRERAERFGLSRESIAALNPNAVVTSISAFGNEGPLAAHTGYDLIAQSYSGLLFADPRPGQTVPQRCGSIPLADITTGLMTVISVLTGLVDRPRRATAAHLSVSLLSSALLTQIQDLVRLDSDPPPPPATAELLHERGEAKRRADDLEPYYGCYETADGFIAVACLNIAQRERMGAVLAISDPWLRDPQAPAASATEYRQRWETKKSVAERLRSERSRHWVQVFRQANVPCMEVRTLESAFGDTQVEDNHLTQKIHQPGVGEVELLGSLLTIDGEPLPQTSRPAPGLGEHNHEILTALSTPHASSGENRESHAALPR
ncbi:CoA transferase [Nocardia sp. NPDC024068]|uniref:CaiB/BaiF CoA transferase family protein n=1 Tax=Nocardia sp. NPDC024068 TaxID=3157197 RepID=UPI0033F6A58D